MALYYCGVTNIHNNSQKSYHQCDRKIFTGIQLQDSMYNLLSGHDCKMRHFNGSSYGCRWYGTGDG